MKTKRFLLTCLFLLIIMVANCNMLGPNQDFKFLADYQKNPDGTITFTLTVRNESMKEIELVSSTSMLYEIEVYEKLGLLIWNWSYDKSFLMVLTSIILQPGEEKVFRETWEVRSNTGQPVPPGTYRVRACLVTKPGANYSFEMNI
jgi:hypothetical protein